MRCGHAVQAKHAQVDVQVKRAAEALRQRHRHRTRGGFIADGNTRTELQANRNLTTHTYDEALAQRVYEFVQREGLALFEQLARRADEWN